MAFCQLLGRACDHIVATSTNLTVVGGVAVDARWRRRQLSMPIGLPTPLPCEEGVLFEPGDGHGEELHQELFQAEGGVLEQDIGADRCSPKLVGLQFHHLELRLGLGPGLGLFGPVHLHAAEERRHAGGLCVVMSRYGN